MTFTVQFRTCDRDPRVAATTRFSHLVDALRYGDSTGLEYDISNESGCIVWAWEMGEACASAQ